MLKVGVLGVGHLGKIHVQLLQQIPAYELVGFYDPDDDNANQAEQFYGIERFYDLEELLDIVDVVDIVTPTSTHFALAKLALKKFKHVFIEKPLTNTLEEAHELMNLAEEANVRVMVGHVERFNPAYLALEDEPVQPLFIESQRLAQFNPRGTDVAVILDLMIHDIDIILQLVRSNVKRISASGVAVMSKTFDIANARIEFDNGCVANVTASRIALKKMRKMRIFQKDAYINLDFLNKKTEIFRLFDYDPDIHKTPEYVMENGTGHRKGVHFERPVIREVNAIKMELELFAKSIFTDTEPPVTLIDAYHSMSVAHSILEKIAKNTFV